MKTDSSRLTRPGSGLSSGLPQPGMAALRPAGVQVPRTSAQHLLTPRLRLPAAWLENRFLVPPSGARVGLPKPTLRFSQSLSPRLPLGLGAWRGGPHGLCSLAHKPEPQRVEPEFQPDSQAEGTINSRQQAWEVPAELSEPLPAYDLSNEKYEDLEQARGDLADEELRDIADPSQNRDAMLRRKKVQLLNEICCSLIKGVNFAEKEDATRERLQVLCEEIAQHDPEFLLKVALYTRQELNIRSTANFLLALSAWLLPSRPHLRRYFCQAVRLPSDWIEVAQLYQSLASDTGSLVPYPSCLRQSLSDRFKGFDEYQLAKYNSRRQRCKNCPTRLRESSPTANETNPKNHFSLKKLVRWLHLKEPAYHIMCLLGRRYPSDLQSFSRSRLPGPWDSRRAGKRMKFELPESWERQLSLHGNTAAVWEQLIDHQKLPFMAMLRNLRNMIAAGISTLHHNQLLRRLTDKDSVIRSRQFPFRFLAAYKALNELQRRLDEKDEPLPTKAALVQKALESLRLPRRRMQSLARSRAAPLQCRGKRVEFVYHWVTKKLEDLKKSRIVRYDHEILERYRRALAAAVEISASHNVSPLPGRTAILCSVSHNTTEPCVSAKGLYVPRTRTKEEEDQAQIRRSPVILDVAVLLALMAHHVSEHAQLILFNNDTYREIELEGGTVLGNVDRVLQEAKSLQESESCSFDRPSGTVTFVMDCMQNHMQIDTILQLDCFYNYNIKEAIQLYRHHVNPDVLFVLVQMSAFHCSIEDEEDSKNVILGGYSDQILRFLCERGSARLLEHVEGIDEVFQLPRARGDRGRKRRKLVEPMASNPLLQSPTLRWRTVRVFVSSTFRDMCSERDLLIRSVFPELRARAARHFVRVEEVDLRWGITEEESRSNRQLELCLSEVSRCQLFVGILGERYGQILSEYLLPDLPQFEWVKSYPRNRSITELEIMQFLRLHDDSPGEHAFFYTRDPAVLRSLPETWMSDFASESEEARTRVAHLKSHVKEAGLLVLENYRSAWGADISGRPFLKGLEEFGMSVLDRLWKAIVSQYCQADCGPAPDEDAFQGAFQEAQARQHHGRLRQLEGTALSIRDRRAGGLFVVHGKHGQGKTAFVASLVTLLSGGSAEHSPGPSHLLFHFTGATGTATDAAGMLHRLCRLLRARLKDTHEPLPQSYRGLVLEFHSLLENFAQQHSRGHLILLIDGADCIQTRNNQRTSDWIPETMPHRVTLVLSVTEDSPLHQALATRKGLVPVHLGPLEPLDRSGIVRRYLAIFGKKLEESAFNNQMRQLVLKKESHNPLFLKLASDELREFGVFEKVSDQIRALPPTLRGLIQHALDCLEREQGQDMVTIALGALHVSTKGLRERDLYCVLCMSRGLPTASALPSWEEMMEEAMKPRRPIPMATFAWLMRSLRSILGIWTPPAEMPASRLQLSGALLRAAVWQRYLRNARRERQLHQLLAVHLWRLTDPEGNGLFANCDPEALPDLPQHLILCGQLSRLASLLTNLHFCHLHLRLGLLAQLNVTFNLYHAAATGDAESEGSLQDVDPYRCFVAANWPILGTEPTLFWQQALNQPEASPVRRQARSQLLAGDGLARKLPEGFRLVEWTNRPQAFSSQGKVMTTPTVPLCVGLSPSGRLAAVGTSEGYLHVLDLESGEEARSLASGCDGISSCVFLGEGSLCATSFDGKIEAWDLADGCRLLLIEGHCDRITGCALSPDAKHLATCSWDRAVKLWTVTQGKLNVSLANPHPLNCVAFHPRGQLLATGSWDRTVRVWNWVTDSVVMALEGHEASVRAVCYSPSGEYLAAASLLGAVFLWSAASGTRVGSYSAHTGPVTQLRYVAGGQYLLSTGTDHQVRIWSGTLGQACGEYGTGEPSPALCLSVSRSRARLAVGYHGDRLCVFHLGTGALVAECKGLRSPVRCLQWLSGESLLASGTEDGLLRVWRLRGSRASCQCLCRGHTRAPASLSLSEHFLASASDDFTVLLWTLAQLVDLGGCAEVSPACVLRGHSDAVTCCSFSPDGLHLVTGSKDKSLLFWDVAALPGQISHTLLSCHRDWITGCCWSPRYVASCSNDGTVCLWDPDSRQCIRELKAQSSTFSCVSIMADLVLSTSGNGELVVWKDTGAIVTTITGHSQRINSLVVFRQEVAAVEVQCEGEQQLSELTAVTASDDGAVRLWYPLLVNEVATLTGHSAPVTGAGTAAGSPFFLTVGADRTARLWDIPSQKAVDDPSQHQGPVTALCWSPSGEFLVSGCRSGEVKVWRSGMALQSVQPHRKQISAVVFLAESRFAVGSYDKRVSIWDLRPQQHPPSVRMCLQSSFSVDGPVSALNALPSRGQLLVGDLNGNLTLWSPEQGNWTAFQSGHFCCYFSRVMERADGSLLAVETPRQTCLRTLRNPSPPPPPEDTEPGEGSEDMEWGADPDEDWEKLTMGPTYNLAPWGLSSPELYNVSLWLTVVKESSSSTTGARSLLCADSRGSLWRSLWDPTVTPVEQPHRQELSDWTQKQVHSDRVTAVTETEELIVTGSYDRTVRLWDRQSLKQVGLFTCQAPVLCLEANPADPSLGACGDAAGDLYFLRWSSCPSPVEG